MRFRNRSTFLVAVLLLCGCAARRDRVRVPAAIQTPPAATQVWRSLGLVPLPQAKKSPPVQPPDSAQASVAATPEPALQHEAARPLPEPQAVSAPRHKRRKKPLPKAPEPDGAPHREPAPVAPPIEMSAADNPGKHPEGGGFGPIGLTLLPVGAAAAWLTGRVVAQKMSKRGG